MRIDGVINLNQDGYIINTDENFRKFIVPLLKKGEELNIFSLRRIFSDDKTDFIEQLKSDKRVERNIEIKYPNKTKKYIKFIILPIMLKDIFKGYKVSFFDITQEKKLENKYIHLNAVLKTVRNINQAITSDISPDKILKEITYQLTNTRGYKASWIILYNKKIKITKYRQCGFNDEFNQFINNIKKGGLYHCYKTSLTAKGVLTVTKSYKTCKDCPLREFEPDGSLMFSPIIYKGRYFGTVSVLIPNNFEFIDEEKTYFKDLVDDIGLYLFNHEIEKKHEKALDLLLKNTKKYQEFFNNSISANVIVKPDGKIIDCNSTFLNLFGFKSKKEALTTNVKSLYFNEKERDKFLNEIQNKKLIKSRKYKYKTKSGDIVFVRENSVAIFNKKNKLDHILIYMNDISKEEELQRQLIQAQKMESLGRVAGGIAHDLNNMLVPIKGYVDLLLLETKNNSSIYSKLTEINKATDRATELIREILAFSKNQILNIETFDINAEINRFRNILKRVISENIKFNIILSDEPLIIDADKTQIDQILMNLAANARDAMPDGGTLTIETSKVYLDESYTYKHVNIKEGEYILLAVTDNGSGMDNKTMSMIFEPFFTTKNNGTGLGLSTVYGIVKQHKGYIIVYSEPGHGTTFKIYFPLSSGKIAAKNIKRQAKSVPLSGKETILLVEDEKDVRNVIKAILTQHGYTVYEASTPSQAVEFVVKEKLKFDLLITDVVLPEMNGRELFNQLSEKIGDFKVLYMSGYTSNVIAHKKMLDNGVFFIQKPFSVSSLLSKVKEVLESS